jgi:hypothetical protein
MALIVTGHQRSGTTLLARLFNAHPEIRLTGEFGNFQEIGAPRSRYVRRMLKRWGGIAVRGWRRNVMIQSNRFVLEYLKRIMDAGTDGVTVGVIEQALHELLPGAKIVGDKYPEYIWNLYNLAIHPALSTVVIYRDCRDLTSSTLVRARGDWRRRMPLFVRKLNTAEKVARRWVRAVDLMETHRDRIFMLRYEDLVTNPSETLSRLSEWLAIDPAGFDVRGITDRSIGKYQRGLTPAEIDTVMEIAGPTMSRLGYS